MDNIVAYRIYQTNKNEFTVHGLFENINNQWLIINHKGEYAGFPAEINITYKTKEEAENAIQNFENSNPNFEHNIHPEVIQDFQDFGYRVIALSPDVYTVQIKFKNDNNWYATGNDGMLTKKSFNTKLYDSYGEATQAMNSFNMKNILADQKIKKIQYLTVSAYELIISKLESISKVVPIKKIRNTIERLIDSKNASRLDLDYIDIPVDFNSPIVMQLKNIKLRINIVWHPSNESIEIVFSYMYTFENKESMEHQTKFTIEGLK